MTNNKNCNLIEKKDKKDTKFRIIKTSKDLIKL